MINAVAKGQRREKSVADELREKGYIIGHKTIRVKYQNLDLFKLFDVMALSGDGSHLLFVQSKSNRCDNKTRDAIRNLKMPDSCRKEIWVWKDRKGWVKEYYD